MTSSPHLLTPQLDQSNRVRACVLNEEDNFQCEILRIMPDLSLDTTVGHLYWIKLQVHDFATKCMLYFIMTLSGQCLAKYIALAGETVLLCLLKFYGEQYI